MASQLYSRYVPPKKKKEAATAQSGAGPSTNGASAPTFLARGPSTRKDASSTYSRYIPPSSKSKSQVKHSIETDVSEASAMQKRGRGEAGGEDDLHTSRSKRSKVEGTTSENNVAGINAGTQAGQTLINGSSNSVDKERTPVNEVTIDKKRKKRRDQAEELPRRDEEEGETVDSRHKSILSRRDKSLKKAEKVTRKVAATTEDNTDLDENKSHLPELEEVHPLERLPQPQPIDEPEEDSIFDSLPLWLSSPIRVSSDATSSFSNLGVPQEIANNLKKLGYMEAFAIQTAVLPRLLSNHGDRPIGDIIVSAATGSGKTLAYVLPMIEQISQTVVTRLQGVIIMPTRELVRQARQVCEACASACASGESRRQLKIGVAIGNQTLKVEQAALMEQHNQVNPKQSQELEQIENAKWDTSNEHPECDFRFDEEMSLSALPDHVVEFSSKVDILICTPGRLVEHIRSTQGFTLDYLKWLVIDEADKLLDQSFQQWLEIVQHKLDLKEQREMAQMTEGLRPIEPQKVVLSATMTRDVGQLSSLKLNAPRLVVLEGSEENRTSLLENNKSQDVLSLPNGLQESAVKVQDSNDKPLYLLELLKRNIPRKLSSLLTQKSARDNADLSDDDCFEEDDSLDNSSDDASSDSRSSDGDSDTSSATSGDSSISSDASATIGDEDLQKTKKYVAKPSGVLIFTKSNENALRLSRLITLLEPAYLEMIGTLTSTIPHSIRKATLRGFQSGEVAILVASDLVARGLDLPNLAHVINYDMPTSLTSYVHRVGRTARAGKVGHAWTLFIPAEGRWFWHEIARTELVRRAAGQKVERYNISGDMFGDDLRKRYENALATLGDEAGAS